MITITRKKGILATSTKKYFGKGKNKKLYTCNIAYKNKKDAKAEKERAKKIHGYKYARISKYKPKYAKESYYGVYVKKR